MALALLAQNPGTVESVVVTGRHILVRWRGMHVFGITGEALRSRSAVSDLWYRAAIECSL